jgi:hypothetical protein
LDARLLLFGCGVIGGTKSKPATCTLPLAVEREWEPMASEALAFQKMLIERGARKERAFLVGLRKRISVKFGPNGVLVFTKGRRRAERDENGKWTVSLLGRSSV